MKGEIPRGAVAIRRATEDGNERVSHNTIRDSRRRGAGLPRHEVIPPRGCVRLAGPRRADLTLISSEHRSLRALYVLASLRVLSALH